MSAMRPATAQDDRALAELVNMAGEGLPFYLWTKMGGGEDPWSVGRARARRETGSFSYKNATVIEADGAVAACLIGYPLAAEPAPIDPAMPAMFVPLQELENLAPDTWYVNVLASYPRFRKLGFGTILLNHAETLAAAAGVKRGMSIIVADSNATARRLYTRAGYRQIADRPIFKENWVSPATAWLLLVKTP